MHPSRRRKKRPNYGIRTVEVNRGPNGFGFTISGQQPCILSCIVSNSPADQAGLRAGDFLISVNGVSVSKIAHDSVVNLIGSSIGPIKMTIAENYYSDSSDEDLEVSRMANTRKPKYMHKPRMHRTHKLDAKRDHSTGCGNSLKNTIKMRECVLKHSVNNASMNANIFKDDVAETVSNSLNISNPIPMDDEAGPIEYKALVGYLGTIEMPKQLLPSSRLHTVCSCIRKLRQEKRTPTAVLMTILPTCLTLKNASNHILAIYPTNRVVYVGSTTDKESRYFGLVTSAICDTRSLDDTPPHEENKKFNNKESEIEISNSCHVFVTDPKLIDHSVHIKKADNFNIQCTIDVVTGKCLEFPRNALYIVSIIQNMYKLQGEPVRRPEDPLLANSPQPSASSNSDSGIGFRDDFGNISDRIVVVEFPAREVAPPAVEATPPSTSESVEPLLNNEIRCNNLNRSYRCKNTLDVRPNDLSKSLMEAKPLNNLNNIRAFDNIKNVLDKKPEYLMKQNNDVDCNRYFGGELRKTASMTSVTSSEDNTRNADVDTGEIYAERPIDVPYDMGSPRSILENSQIHQVETFTCSDNVSMHSSKSLDLSTSKPIFKTPSSKLFDRKTKKNLKLVSSCDNLDKYDKLSPKVYGVTKPNYSYEELSNIDGLEPIGFGSLNEMFCNGGKHIAQSEPDVRIKRSHDNLLCDQNVAAKSSQDAVAGWALSFEKLLEDRVGLKVFSEFLKKEFSAENIDFWSACETYRKLPLGDQKTKEAHRIYQQHLCKGAPEPVNVDAHGRHCTENGLKSADNTLFDQAQKQIFNLMKFDSYPRFLKSDLYKQCVVEAEKNAGALTPSAPTKLKKSLSNAEDRRRKSLLPWHRKNRSKSKDREAFEQSKVEDANASQVFAKKDELHSSKSSLTSLDLAITTIAQDVVKGSREELASGRTALCRISLGTDSTTVVQIKTQETIAQLVHRLLDKRGLTYNSFEVTTDKHLKPMDINHRSLKLAGCEVKVEQRVVFKLDLPNKKIISVKSKSRKLIVDVLRPILHKYNYNLDQVSVLNKANELVDVHQSVTTIDGARLNILLCEEASINESKNASSIKANKLVEITNQVFEGILQEKAENAHAKQKSDKGSVKSEDWGSEHSSILGKLLRRDSGVQERRKKSQMPRPKSVFTNPSAPEENQQSKKPLIAKWKAGVNKLQVSPCSESDELVEGLTRAQKSRLEDQRGTEINFELPDFLKDKENEKLQQQKMEVDSQRPYSYPQMNMDITPTSSTSNTPTKSYNFSSSNYENRTVFLQEPSANLNNMRVYPATSDEPMKISGNSLSPSKGGRREYHGEPPPLPPKPKIIPIKPSNWGFYSSGAGDSSDKRRKQALFLEQPSSSFV